MQHGTSRPGFHLVILAVSSLLLPSCGGGVDLVEVEFAQCQDREDNDGDGQLDLNDPDCDSPDDNSESPPQCADGIDNDGDALIDLQDYG